MDSCIYTDLFNIKSRKTSAWHCHYIFQGSLRNTNRKFHVHSLFWLQTHHKFITALLLACTKKKCKFLDLKPTHLFPYEQLKTKALTSLKTPAVGILKTWTPQIRNSSRATNTWRCHQEHPWIERESQLFENPRPSLLSWWKAPLQDRNKLIEFWPHILSKNPQMSKHHLLITQHSTKLNLRTIPTFIVDAQNKLSKRRGYRVLRYSLVIFVAIVLPNNHIFIPNRLDSFENLIIDKRFSVFQISSEMF